MEEGRLILQRAATLLNNDNVLEVAPVSIPRDVPPRLPVSEYVTFMMLAEEVVGTQDSSAMITLRMTDQLQPRKFY